MNNRIHQPVVNSMLWSAYADALGFMSEMVDRAGLQMRTGRDSVSGTVAWTYRVGGRYGPQVPLPPGMYSDDTQLRLATARAIGRGGAFNVEAFAKVELPVWLSYALGGGKGSKAAAANLSRDNVSWCSNFYNAGDTRYLESGGNGAAMRIQPHIWATNPNSDMNELLLNVTRNTVCTHGHSRAIVGALLNALVLADTLHHRELAPPDRWISHLCRIRDFPAIIAKDEYLGVLWLSDWQRQCGSFATAVSQAVEECIQDITAFRRYPGKHPESEYPEFLGVIGGMDRAMRGSGTKTAVAALALAWLFQHDAEQGVLTSANTLGSDTDTIGTMAGALLGVITDKEPAGDVCDKELLIEQALRLIDIGGGADVPDFSYPSLLEWKPPRTASDSAGRIGARYGVSGLGIVDPLDDKTYATREKQSASLRWVRTTFGQTILVKMRQELQELSVSQLPQTQAPLRQPLASHRSPKEEVLQRPESPQDIQVPRAHRIPEQQSLSQLFRAGAGQHAGDSDDLDRLTQAVIRSGFDPWVTGEAFLGICNEDKAIEKCIAFAAIIAKAKTARRNR